MSHKIKEEILQDVTSIDVDAVTSKAVPILLLFVIFYVILNNMVYAAILTAFLFGLAYYYQPKLKTEKPK